MQVHGVLKRISAARRAVKSHVIKAVIERYSPVKHFSLIGVKLLCLTESRSAGAAVAIDELMIQATKVSMQPL